MRRVLTGLAFALIPVAASAECGCTCADGRPMPVCSLPTDTPPICQFICPTPLNQSISTQPVSGTINSGGIVTGSASQGGQAYPTSGGISASAASPFTDPLGRGIGGTPGQSAASSAGASTSSPTSSSASAFGRLPNAYPAPSLGGLPAAGR